MSLLARNTDPISSHLAAHDIIASGTRTAHHRLISKAVVANPGCTAAELAQHVGLSHVQTSRRMKECEGIGWISRGDLRTCKVGGRLAGTWWPTLEAMLSAELQ
jgi:hypothetical protein